MIKYLLISALLFFTYQVNAQNTVGLNHRLHPIEQGEYSAYTLSYEANDNGSFNVKIYYSDDQILMEGTSLDSLGQQFDGISTWYYKSGVVQSEGEYKNGQKQGTWKRYNEDGSAKSDRHYSEVNMDNIVFNSALVMPKPNVEYPNFEAYVKEMVLKEQAFDIVQFSPVAIQLIITNEGIVSDSKYDNRLSNQNMQILDDIIKQIPSWRAGSNGTQTLNVKVDYAVNFKP